MENEIEVLVGEGFSFTTKFKTQNSVKIGQHQIIFYILLRRKVMRILYLQLGLQIDYIYYCYNHKQFTLHLQYKQPQNVKRQIHNTLIYFQNVPQKMFLDPLNWILQLCWLTRHDLAINSLQYFCYQNILNVSRMLGICILTLSSKRIRINKLLEIINWYFFTAC